MNRIYSLLFVLILSACAAQMPLDKSGLETAQIGNGALAIFTLEIHNELKDYAPRPATITVKSSDPLNSIGSKKFSFSEPVQELGERGMLLRGSFELPAGEYYVTQLAGFGGSALISGRFYFNPNAKFALKAGELVYLGRMIARLVQKTSSDQERAGPFLPLIDQAVTGFFRGTFAVEIQDRFNEDIPQVIEKHPYLKEKLIKKSLLTTVIAAGQKETEPSFAPAASELVNPVKVSEEQEVASSFKKRLGTLDKLLAEGVISQREYDARRKDILKEL